jgi:hypothetical protein
MKLQLSDGTFLTLDDKYTDDQALKLWYSAEDQLKAGKSINKNPQFIENSVTETKMQETEQSYLGMLTEDSVDFIKHNPDAMIFFSIVIGVVVVLFIMRKNIFSGFKKIYSVINLFLVTVFTKLSNINFQTFVLIILFFIAFEIFKIEQKITSIPTRNDYLALKNISDSDEVDAKRDAITNSIPIVHINGGDIDVSGTVDIGNISSTVDVNVENTVDVRIDR